MTWPRHVLLVVALLVAGSLAAPTAGFSSAAADRDVEVAVVSDDDAYLGVRSECNDDTLQVTVTNRFAPGTAPDVAIAVNGTTETVDGLESGESRSRRFDAFGADDAISVRASDSGVSVRLARPLPAGC